MKKENQNNSEGIIFNVYTPFGKGYGVAVFGSKKNNYRNARPSRSYYPGECNHSKKEAVALYRKEWGLQRKHLMLKDCTNDPAHDINYI